VPIMLARAKKVIRTRETSEVQVALVVKQTQKLARASANAPPFNRGESHARKSGAARANDVKCETDLKSGSILHV
jgi:hypothetical protein